MKNKIKKILSLVLVFILTWSICSIDITLAATNEREPNDSRATATLINEFQTAGTISSYDTDWFRLVPSDIALTIRVDASSYGASVGLYDSSGSLLRTESFSTNSHGNICAVIVYLYPSTGRNYYLKITSSTYPTISYSIAANGIDTSVVESGGSSSGSGTTTGGCAQGYHTGSIISDGKGYAATCIEEGKTDGTKYSCCGKAVTTGKTLAKTSHQYASYVAWESTTAYNGCVVKECTVCGKEINTTVNCIDKFKLSATSYTYNGKAKKPSVKVYDSAGKLISSSNYTVSYKNNKNVGKATVTINFKGNYGGTKILNFTISPQKASVSKLTPGKKSLKVRFKKPTKQINGCEVQYATNKKFKSAKTKTVKGYKTTSTTIKKLKAKKTYYVRIRTYKTVVGKKYYSTWSTSKSKKTK